MRTRTCKTCGKQFIVSAGRDQYLCEECARKAKSDSVIRERTCRTCGVSFMGYPRSMYCPSCRAERKKQQKKTYIRNKAKRPLGSTDICVSCGGTYIVNSGRQRYCPECAKVEVIKNIRRHKADYMADNSEKSRELKKDTRGKRYVCPICGKEFEKHTTTVTCSPECAREYRRRKQNEADIRRGTRKLPADQRYSSGLPQSGVVGVTWHRQCGKWQATYKRKYIGLFDTVELAAAEIEKYAAELSTQYNKDGGGG